jgi:hypothetical protein
MTHEADRLSSEVTEGIVSQSGIATEEGRDVTGRPTVGNDTGGSASAAQRLEPSGNECAGYDLLVTHSAAERVPTPTQNA